MKKNYFYFLLLLNLFVKAQTSVYHPMPDSNAVWNIHYVQYCFVNGMGDEYYSITISGDTLINGQVYHKFFTPYVQSFSTGTCGFNSLGYNGAYRDDTLQKKIFYIPPSDTTEQLLYDFTMQVGDTLKGFLKSGSFSWATDTVQSVDSVLIGGSYRKRININNWYNVSLIEGVGSIYGLIIPSPGYITDMPSFDLTCFTQNGQALYPNTSINCQLITSENSIDKDLPEVKIFPNPSNGSFAIDFGKTCFKEIWLTDICGRLICFQKTTNQTLIYINDLPNGTYILRLDGENNIPVYRKISCTR
ncbi:MAG: T9SS type A sorting domain-containing protein [Bacteroidia bacterium]|nr:T9SS type A sorting domain-containing protein [Bacteroidia bacterium]